MLESNLKINLEKYITKKIDRRSFLVATGVFTGSLSLGGIVAYYYRKLKIEPPYTISQNIIIQDLHDHLFPKSDDSPGATDINSVDYLHFVLIDPNIDEDDKNLLISSITWLDEECQNLYSDSFIELTSSEKDNVLRTIEDSNWGYRFISLNLLYIFEALLTDPIYGGNLDEIGWNWLDHTPGVPRPTKQTMYGEI